VKVFHFDEKLNIWDIQPGHREKLPDFVSPSDIQTTINKSTYYICWSSSSNKEVGQAKFCAQVLLSETAAIFHSREESWPTSRCVLMKKIIQQPRVLWAAISKRISKVFRRQPKIYEGS